METYASGILNFTELLGAVAALRKHVRTGRIQGELLVTPEAFERVPSDDIERFPNGQGEEFLRKKLTVYGSPMAIMTITTLVPADG